MTVDEARDRELDELAKRAGEEGDPQLGLEVARRILRNHARLMPPCLDCRDGATGWFGWALAVDPELRWDVAEAWEGTLHRDAFAAAMRQAVTNAYPNDQAPGITTHENLFAVNEVEGLHMAFAVRSEHPDRVAAALVAAEPRLMRVGWKGQEFVTDEELEAAEEAAQQKGDWGAIGTPNYVSDVELVDGDPRIWLDIKDSESVPQARTMLAIVVEELLRAGVKSAEIRSA